MVLGKFHNALLTTEIGVWKCHAEISDFYLLLIFQIHTLGKAYKFPNSPLIIIIGKYNKTYPKTKFADQLRNFEVLGYSNLSPANGQNH